MLGSMRSMAIIGGIRLYDAAFDEAQILRTDGRHARDACWRHDLFLRSPYFNDDSASVKS